jgi:sulfite dehydrogenase
VIVLDANSEPVAMPDGFAAHWSGPLRGRLIYRPSSPALEIDARARTVLTRDGDRVRFDLINVVPAQQAAALLRAAGLVDARSRWVRVAWDTLESVHAPGVHVLGDATLAARGMPKSAGVAAEHGRVAAAAIVARLEGRVPAPPELRDEGFAHVDERSALRYTTRLRWSAARRTLVDDGTDGPDAESVDARRAQRSQQQALDALFG